MNLFVPGRVCLFGEHSDWAGTYRTADPAIRPGHAIIVGTQQGLYADAETADSLVLTSTTSDGTVHGPVTIPMDVHVLSDEARTGGFWSYIAGVAAVMMERHGVTGGIRLTNTKTDLPVKKGLSSSAAVCVLTARAFNRVYGLGLSVEEEMEIAFLGETRTPSRCGRMDQGCAYGATPVLMTFDGDRLATRPLGIGAPIHLVVADLMAGKDTKRILSGLNACYPATDTPVARGVRRLLGELNETFIARAEAALATGDAQRLGTCMTDAQASFDELAAPACPDQLTAPVLHRILTHPAVVPFVFGGKGVGSQGDGSVQFTAKSGTDRDALLAVLNGELGLSAFGLTLHPDNGVADATAAIRGQDTLPYRG